MKSKNISSIQLALSSVLIISFWIVLSAFNRLVDDDLIMLRCIQNTGVWATMIDFYNNWNTRWASYLLQGFWYKQWTFSSIPILYNISTLLFMVICCYVLIDSFLKKLKIDTIIFFTKINYSILLFGGIIASTYHIGDTWFWVSASTMYGWNLGCGILVLAIFLKTPQLWHLLILIPLALFIGGASEPFAIGLILFPLFLSLSQLRKIIKIDWRHILTWIVIALSFGIAIAGKGHSVRSSLLPTYSFSEYFLRSGYFSIKLLLYHSPLRIIIAFFLLMPFYTLGSLFHNPEKTNMSEFLKKKIIPIMLFWSSWVIFHAIIIIKIMGNYGPPRAWSAISLLSALLLSYLLFESGRNQLIKKENILKPLYYLVIIFIFSLTTYQYLQLNRYYSADEKSLIMNKLSPGLLHKKEMK